MKKNASWHKHTVVSLLVAYSFAAVIGCGDGTATTTASGTSSSSSSGDVSSSSSGMAGAGGMGSGGMAGSGGMGTGGMGTGGMGTGGMGTGGMGTGGMGSGGNVTITIVDDATFIKCSEAGADQLGGTAFVSFQNDTGMVQNIPLKKATTKFVNGANSMDMTLNMQWSMSNPGTANQIATGLTPSVIYKAQPGAPNPPKNPCDFCPFMGGNGNTLPTVTLTLEFDVNGSTVTAVSTPELKSCL